MVESTAERASVNLISTISAEGELRWMRVEGKMNAERFIEFLAALIKRKRKPVFVIVGGHPAHRAKAVKEFVERNEERLELHFLPSYSPQFNPDELVWNHLESHIIGKRGFLIAKHRLRRVEEHMNCLRGARALIRSFFDEPHRQYAKS